MQYAILNLPAIYSLYISEMCGDYTILIDGEFCSMPFFETSEEAKQAAYKHYEAHNENQL